MNNLISPMWPALPFSDWEKTCDTLHMWTQIVGKTRMGLEPLVNHWWNVVLYVTPVGLGTTPIPFDGKTFDIEFDFVQHRVQIRSSEGRSVIVPLYARSVADFYSEYMAALRSLGIEIKINRTPAEFDDSTPHDEDRHHASYDKTHVESFRRILVQSDRVLKDFRTRFLGKCSPVHFFWGSFDLAVSRFSGLRTPQPASADRMTKEGYSHEVISCGFWPGDRRFKEPAFYSYTAPAPAGIDAEPFWNSQMGEFILKYDDVRSMPSPATEILSFCQKTYESGARLAKWDRNSCERTELISESKV